MTTQTAPLPAVAAAVEDLRNSHRALLHVVDSLSPNDWGRYVPYGEWTVKDLVAHLVGDMSPGWPGLILAGVLTPSFIADMGKGYDSRTANSVLVNERKSWTREDLRQMLFEAHDQMIEHALRLGPEHQPVLAYTVPMGPGCTLSIMDFLWRGAHDRQHADDIRRALEVDYSPRRRAFIPEIEASMRRLVLAHETLLRVAYSVADDAWDEPAADAGGWTYHDVLAHVSSNEMRRVLRLRTALEGPGVYAPDDVLDVDEFNSRSVAERRGWPLRQLVDEFMAGWDGVLDVLSRFTPEALNNNVIMGGGREPIVAAEFIQRMPAHTTTHAGQLVPGSRARRLGGE